MGAVERGSRSDFEKEFRDYLSTTEGKLEGFCRMTYGDLMSVVERIDAAINYNLSYKKNIEALNELKNHIEKSLKILLKVEIKKERKV